MGKPSYVLPIGETEVGFQSGGHALKCDFCRFRRIDDGVRINSATQFFLIFLTEIGTSQFFSLFLFYAGLCFII